MKCMLVMNLLVLIALALNSCISFENNKDSGLPDSVKQNVKQNRLVNTENFQVSTKIKSPQIMNKEFWLFVNPSVNHYQQYKKSELKNEPMIKNAGFMITPSPVWSWDTSELFPLSLYEMKIYETGKNDNIASSALVSAEGNFAELFDLQRINDEDTLKECALISTDFSFTFKFPRHCDINRISVYHADLKGRSHIKFNVEYIPQNETAWKNPLILPSSMNSKSPTEITIPSVVSNMIRVKIKCSTIPVVAELKGVGDIISVGNVDFSKTPLLIMPEWKSAGIWRSNRPYSDCRMDNSEYERYKKKYKFGFCRFFTGEWDNDFYICSNWDGHWTAFRKNAGINVVVPQPSTRKDALAEVKAYYEKRRAAYWNNMLDFSVMLPWDHYLLEWSDENICCMETTGYGAPSHQLQVAFCRGAARQYNAAWGWYLAYWWEHASPLYTSPPLANTNNLAVSSRKYPKTPYGGISVSLAMRDMYLSYLNGAAFLVNESWPEGFFQPSIASDYGSKWKLSPLGEILKEWFAFTQKNTVRGTSYVPVAILLDYYHGWSPSFSNKQTWFCFPPEQKDRMITSFMYTLFPWKQERADNDTRLFNSPYGDIYDVLIANPPSGKLDLSPYKVAFLIGDVKPDKTLYLKLREYVRQGGTLIINSKQVTSEILPDFIGVVLHGETVPCGKKLHSLIDDESVMLHGNYNCDTIKLNGAEPLLVDENKTPVMTINNYGKGKVILTTAAWMIENDLKDARKKSPLAEFLLRHIVPEVLPFKIEGDIEYGLNKLDDGWIVYLINNKGVHKKPTEAATFDMKETSTVKLIFETKPEKILELREGRDIPAAEVIRINVLPGDIKILKIIE